MLCSSCSTLLFNYNKHNCVKCNKIIEKNMFILCDDCSFQDQTCSVCLKKTNGHLSKKNRGCRCQSK